MKPSGEIVRRKTVREPFYQRKIAAYDDIFRCQSSGYQGIEEIVSNESYLSYQDSLV
jgi:hypothetical protein